ncbi:MAG: hypothetical protein DKINENOH_04349 [bacterium]|nr:hypothetical protein [bacterium]
MVRFSTQLMGVVVGEYKHSKLHIAAFIPAILKMQQQVGLWVVVL